MNIISATTNRHFSGLLLHIFLAIATVNCTSAPISSQPELTATPLPEYYKGTTYIYSDGSWETVTDNTNGTVKWIDYRGKVSSGSPDFIYRRTEWRSKTRQGIREYTTRSDLAIRGDQALWPLRAGNTTRFTEIGTWRQNGEAEKSYQTEWTCNVVGTERASVMAGTFDTWKIVCKRYRVSKISNKSTLREKKTWFYAPSAGHYVLTTTQYFYRKKPLHLELLAVIPPNGELSENERRQIDKHFQQALEFKESGKPVKWSLPKKRIAGEIRPTDTFQIPQGAFCRRYVQKLNRPDSQKTYYGMACRDPQKGWIIPHQ